MIDRKSLHQKIRELTGIPRGEAHVLVLLEKYIQDHSADTFAVLAYADALRVVGRHSEAEELLTPKFPSASLAAQAEIAMALALSTEVTKPKDAEEWFSKYVTLVAPVPGWAWVLRGANLAKLERFDLAIECYEKALEAGDVDRDEALFNIALAYRAKGDYEQALVYLNRADMVRRTPASAELRIGLEGLEETRRFLDTM